MLASLPQTDRTGREIRRAVVIGAAGFIGSRLSSALTDRHVDTACFTRACRFLYEDELSYPLWTTPVIYYLASSINPALGEQHPEWATADHQLFATLLRGLSRVESPPTVVLTSSGGTVYDADVPPPYSERSPVRATGRYAAAKLALERELFRYAGTIPSVVLRLSNVYGPGQSAGKGQGVLAYWLRAARDGQPLRIVGDPESSRDYVYIDDVVDCMRRVDQLVRDTALNEPLVLNVGSGIRVSLRELFAVVRSVVDRELPVQPMPYRHLDRQHVWLDVRRAGEVLGWQPETTLHDGVSRMWRWVLAQP